MPNLIVAIWLILIVVWGLLSFSVKGARRKESQASRWSHVLPLLLAGWLLFDDQHVGAWLRRGFLTPSVQGYWLGVLLAAAGVALAIWARLYLGGNWSASVTVKREHELVTSGPYAWVRHPIYSGILLAMLGTTIAIGEWRGVLALAITFAAFWRKLRIEERWMAETFGDTYAAYCARTKALIPFMF